MNRIGSFVFKFFNKSTSNTTIKKLICKKYDKQDSYMMSFSIGSFRYYSSHLEVPEPTPTKSVTSGLEPVSAKSKKSKKSRKSKKLELAEEVLKQNKKDLYLYLSRIINWEFDWLEEKGSFSLIKSV